MVGGIGYGIMHRRTLQAREDARAVERAYKHKEHLIEQAKKAYADRLVASKAGSGGEYRLLLGIVWAKMLGKPRRFGKPGQGIDREMWPELDRIARPED